MALVKQNKEYNTFIKGLITEANILAFPENASVDEDNLVLNRDGSRRRRLGMDYENLFAKIDTGINTGVARNSLISCHRWDNAGNIPDLSIGVIHVFNKLFFVDLTATSFSAAMLNGGNAVSIYGTYDYISTAVISGYLVCATKGQNPFYLTYDGPTDTVTMNTIQIKIRDFFGVDDGLAVNTRPTSLEPLHHYNLLNQGWTNPILSKTGVVDAEVNCQTITEYDPMSGEYVSRVVCDTVSQRTWAPSNADIAHLGKDTTGAYSSTQLIRQFFGTSNAPKGKHIIDYRFRGASRASQSGLTGLPVDQESGRVSCVTSYAGRVFYSGVSSSVTGGDDRSPNYSGSIFFSRVIRNVNDFGFCYSEADPTSEHISDIIDTDGGYINIPEAAGILRIEVIGDAIAVIADNGIWEISGGNGAFTSTNYQVRKVSNVGAISASSVINAEGPIMYWSVGGIYVISNDEVTANLIATNITQTTIQSYYNSIPSLGKAYATATYNPIEKKIRWLYNDTATYATGPKTSFNRELILDTQLQAFYLHSISSTGADSPYIAGYITSPTFTVSVSLEPVAVNGVNVTVAGENVTVGVPLPTSRQENVKYLTMLPTSGSNMKFTFSEYKYTKFMDWFSYNGIGVDYLSYLVTGYESLQDTQRNKAVNYITFHFMRTEDGFDLLNGEIILANQSSCKVQSRWEWTNSASGGRWGTEFQAYRYKLNYIPSSVSDPLDYSYRVITTKNKLRGSGKVLSMYLHSETGKDMYLLGWGVDYAGASVV